MEAVLEDPYILIFEKKMTSMEELVPLLEDVMKSGGSLLIIAEEVEAAALAILDDIAILTESKQNSIPESVAPANF